MTSVSAILEQTAVAYYSEITQAYVCPTCRWSSMIQQWQPVSDEAASTLALELGMTTCTRCQQEIGYDRTEPQP